MILSYKTLLKMLSEHGNKTYLRESTADQCKWVTDSYTHDVDRHLSILAFVYSFIVGMNMEEYHGD